MGIYIRDIEKPKSCEECPLTARDEWEDLYCVILTDDILAPKDIMTDCPLIEIPDEIWESLKPKVDTMSMALKGWVEDVLKSKNRFGVDNGEESR